MKGKIKGFVEESKPITVYLCSEQKAILIFKNGNIASEHLAIKSVSSYCHTKVRSVTNALGERIAFRFSNDEQKALLGDEYFVVLDDRFKIKLNPKYTKGKILSGNEQESKITPVIRKQIIERLQKDDLLKDIAKDLNINYSNLSRYIGGANNIKREHKEKNSERVTNKSLFIFKFSSYTSYFKWQNNSHFSIDGETTLCKREVNSKKHDTSKGNIVNCPSCLKIYNEKL